MDQVRAFVGHSFSPEDADVVRRFLEFFDHIVDIGIGFSWEHAEEAEPSELSEKVLRLIVDKNVFIGICTKKEIVVDPSRLRRLWYSGSIYKVRNEHITYKTSDWIIQEIGLAVGRNLQLILLVEDDLRVPGGLQGNLERVPFSRQRPEASFNKLLEMIHSLRPKVKTYQASEAPISSAAKEEETTDDIFKEWINPNPDWSQHDFERGLSHSILSEASDAETRICEAYKQTDFARTDINVVIWEAYREYLKIRWGKGGSLSTIETHFANYPNLERLAFYLGRCYSSYKDDRRAANFFEQAASLTTDVAKRNEYLGCAALAHQAAGEHAEKDRILAALREHSRETAAATENALRATIAIAEKDRKEDVVAGCYEALVNLRPDDLDVRFKLAFWYSKMKRQDLATFHYLAIPHAGRGSSAWNNIGVAYSNQQMPIRAVRAFREAVRLGETLAMSNLAMQFLDAGFVEEAEALCNQATAVKDYDKQVGSTITRIKDAEEEEGKKDDKLLGSTREVREFYRDYGLASIGQVNQVMSGHWKSRRCELEIKVIGKSLTAIGRYEVDPAPNTLALFASSGGGGTRGQHIKYEVQYRGNIFGATAFCDVAIDELGKTKTVGSLLSDAASTKSALMIFSSDGNTIRVFEKDGSAPAFIEEWMRIQ